MRQNGRLQEVKNNEVKLPVLNLVVFAYRRLLFTLSFQQLLGFDWENFGILDQRSLVGGCCL